MPHSHGPEGLLPAEMQGPANGRSLPSVAVERSCLDCREPVTVDRVPAWARCGSCGLHQRVTAAGALRWPATGSAAQAWARSLGVDRPDV